MRDSSSGTFVGSDEYDPKKDDEIQTKIQSIEQLKPLLNQDFPAVHPPALFPLTYADRNDADAAGAGIALRDLLKSDSAYVLQRIPTLERLLVQLCASEKELMLGVMRLNQMNLKAIGELERDAQNYRVVINRYSSSRLAFLKVKGETEASLTEVVTASDSLDGRLEKRRELTSQQVKLFKEMERLKQQAQEIESQIQILKVDDCRKKLLETSN